MAERQTKLDQLMEESKRLIQQSSEINERLAEIHTQIASHKQKMMEGSSSSHEMPTIDQDSDKSGP